MKGKPAKHVLVIPSWYPPKGGYFFREHALALAEAGLKVDVLAGLHTSLRSLRPGNLLQVRETEINTIGRVKEYLKKYWIIPYSNRGNFHGWVNMMLRFYKSYEQQAGKPGLILAHSSIWAGLVAAFIKEKYGVPYVITEHRSRFVYNTKEAREMFEPWFFPYLKTAFENAAAVVTVSESLQPFIREIAPQAEGKLHSIPNMVDTGFFIPAGEKNKGKPFRFFSLANLIPLKGMDILIEAFARANQARPGVLQLVIGGDGPERARLEGLVSEKELQKQIIFTGKLRRQQVKDELQQGHAFVLASHFEAFGVVFIEAMACGLPVIATRAGGPESFITEGQGILLEPGKVELLAQAMLDMQEHYDRYLPKEIRRDTISRFGKQAVAQQYLELFDTIIK